MQSSGAASFVERLGTRLEAAQIAASPAAHTDDGATAAGRWGEADAARELEARQHRLPGINALHVFRGVRLPDPVQGGHKEIDLVLASHDGVVVVEVKNWSGQVSLATDGSGSWLQRRRDGSELRHPR
jgi:hypothetical protein